MKAGCYTQVFILGLFLGLLCSVISSELPSNNRILDSVPSHHYKYERESTDADGTLHIFAVYGGSQNSFGSSEIVKNIEMIVSFHDKNTFRIKIKDEKNERWEIPEKAPYPHFQSDAKIPQAESSCEVIIEKEPFYFYVKRKDTGAILFDTRGKDFLFSDLYIQLSSSVPTDNIYGFGERNYKFKLSPGIYSIWGRDDFKIRQQEGVGGGNTYSHHPVGFIRDNEGKFFLTLMRNSNAMDVIIERDNSNNYDLTYKMVGGVIDLIFFIGQEYPEPLLKSYHNYLGNFTMMPFWSMGYHQSKWGYLNYDTMNDVVSKYSEHDLPLDVIWSDLDYMNRKEIFTVDTDNFPPEKMKELTTKHKKKWVPIIDPGVRVDGPVGPGLKTGLEKDLFIKKYNGGNLRGYVWPGHVYFPDFHHPATEQYWKDNLEVLYQIIPFAGIWLDMNEVANFVEGETPARGPNRYDQLPYTPGSHPLNHKTISLDAKHHGGEIEYNVHTLYSLLENKATHSFLKTKSKLPFILTRGTSMGLGQFSAHWSGDNGAHWEFLQDSIPGNFNFQIYGIPFVGADICGFMDGTNAELCARWTQLGALYPFARNHHEEQTRNQEPWTFNEFNRGVSVIETTRAALKTRYAILKWYYSLFIETEGTGSIFKPLMFEFPAETELYNDGFGDRQFLLGKGLMCTPKVESGEPHVEAYFPKATWYELFTGKRFISKEASDRTKRVETPFNASVPMFLRGGHILYQQDVTRVLSTEDLNNEFELIVAVDRENEQDTLSAKGTMMGIQTFDDDSVHDRCMKDNCLYDISVTVPREDVASVSVEISFKRQKQDVRLDSFSLFGLRLYGLPLEFMAEDESKIGYGLLEITDEKGEIFTNPDLVELISIENNAFQIRFDSSLKIEDGNVLKLELLI